MVLLFSPIALWAQANEAERINQTMDEWHKAAADADFNADFSKMTQNGIFIGTDAMENCQNGAFRTFSQPYFDKEKTWNFTPVERNVHVDGTKDVVRFDELLDAHMELCRGSGVLKKVNGMENCPLRAVNSRTERKCA